MTAIEQKADITAAENAAACRADDEGRAGVIAKRQKAGGVLAAELTALRQRGERSGAQRITAGESEQQRRRHSARRSEKQAHCRCDTPCEQCGQLQRRQQP